MAPLSSHDEALGFTLWVNDLIDAGRFYDEVVSQPVTFAPMSGDTILRHAPFSLDVWGAPGDGTYTTNGGFFFATGGVGLALTAGVAVAQGISNSARRKQAMRDLQPRWLPSDRGMLYVSDQGFYLATSSGFHTWSWDAVTSVALMAPATILLSGNSDRGAIQWRFTSDVAELLFTLWARVRNPQHPQFTTRTWLPTEWFQRLSASGRALPPTTSGRWLSS